MSLPSPNCFFITATDTGSGKTTVTRMLIQTLQQSGYRAVGCKPIACGLDEEGCNEDVRVYEAINSLPLPRDQINPVCLSLPASPNIAAAKEQYVLEASHLSQKLKALQKLPCDVVFFEGVGGWKVPINSKETMVDVVSALLVPIILVIGIKVGCLNHALLTGEAIQGTGLPIVGWIGNVVDPATPAISDHLATLGSWLKAPCLAVLPFGATHFDSLHLDCLTANRPLP
jgi:dethiobiotin synthetase